MILAVVAIIEHDDEILIGKKIESHTHEFSDSWHLPGGKANEDESPEEAVAREMLEETGLNIVVKLKLAESRQPDKRVVWLLCSPVNIETLKPGDDLSDAKFVTKEEAFKLLHEKALTVWPKEVFEYLKH